MSARTTLVRVAAASLGLALGASAARAAELRVAVPQAEEHDTRKYRGLVDYLALRGLSVRWVPVAGYRAAAEAFEQGTVDAMFGGTGVACAMMVKGVAEPFARPLFTHAPGVHSAVVVARKGTAPFDGTAGWFAGKRVAFPALAAAGEFFFRALGPSQAAATAATATDDEALALLARGEADAVVVRSRVWDEGKGKHPQLEQVGIDEGANPDAPVVLSSRLDPAIAGALFQALTALTDDPTPAAAAARHGLAIRGYVRATAKDFQYPTTLVRRAGVTARFAYRF